MSDQQDINSPDDALEETRHEDALSLMNGPLEEDNDRPAAPAEDHRSLPDDYPAFDDINDHHEIYDTGPVSGSSAYDISEDRESLYLEED